MAPSFLRPWCVLRAVVGATVASGCAVPPTGMQLAQQTAQDFNLDSRFGRGDLVLSRVDPALREDYAAHHRAWGAALRIADIEMAGIKPHDDGNVDVFVRVSWYRVAEQELKQTTIIQHWHSKSDAWLLTSEKRQEGDPGLLGEPIVIQAPAEHRSLPQFPTVRIGSSEDAVRSSE